MLATMALIRCELSAMPEKSWGTISSSSRHGKPPRETLPFSSQYCCTIGAASRQIFDSTDVVYRDALVGVVDFMGDAGDQHAE